MTQNKIEKHSNYKPAQFLYLIMQISIENVRRAIVTETLKELLCQ